MMQVTLKLPHQAEQLTREFRQRDWKHMRLSWARGCRY